MPNSTRPHDMDVVVICGVEVVMVCDVEVAVVDCGIEVVVGVCDFEVAFAVCDVRVILVICVVVAVAIVCANVVTFVKAPATGTIPATDLLCMLIPVLPRMSFLSATGRATLESALLGFVVLGPAGCSTVVVTPRNGGATLPNLPPTVRMSGLGALVDGTVSWEVVDVDSISVEWTTSSAEMESPTPLRCFSAPGFTALLASDPEALPASAMGCPSFGPVATGTAARGSLAPEPSPAGSTALGSAPSARRVSSGLTTSPGKGPTSGVGSMEETPPSAKPSAPGFKLMVPCTGVLATESCIVCAGPQLSSPATSVRVMPLTPPCVGP
mmetsp:Transcript_141106/g.393283  ORF Transcript_141106/g.393283 Transcript_141106/m.393283 type:complete len:326 (-) Transcript_141106:559-1536(-)